VLLGKLESFSDQSATVFLSFFLSVILFRVRRSSSQASRNISLTSSPDGIDENIDPALFGRAIKVRYPLQTYQLVEGDIVN
jgi:hypothetical protein